MPCRYEPTPEEIRVGHQTVLDRLTRENDELREIIFNLINDSSYVVPKKILDRINKDQVAHRKKDLERLTDVLIANKDIVRLAKVWEADPTKPLEEQLGFDPNEF